MARAIPPGAVLVAALSLAGCARAPPPPMPAPAPLTTATPAQMLAAVHEAGATADTELAVRPLRDPATADLRDLAAAQQAAGDHAAAAATLDRALALSPDDPAILQERAEAALLGGDFPAAEAHALRAHGLGSQLGPMCRRHWTTVEQVRLAAGDAAGAADARTRVAACRVDRPARY